MSFDEPAGERGPVPRLARGTYLVTGAAGFIGGALAERLAAEGSRVVTVDNLSTGRLERIPDSVQLIRGDCQDPQVVDLLRDQKFDAIFHVAGQSSGEVSFDDPVYDLQTNTQSTLLLLKLAVETGCRKFVYASSMSVYGDQPDLPTPETAELRPKSFYGVGKIASEHYIRLFGKLGIEGCALRLFNVYGPGQNMRNLRQGMVSIFLAQALEEDQILVRGSADRFRDFVYIDDVVDAFVAVASEVRSFRIYNVGTGVRTTVGELVERLRKLLPGAVDVEYRGSTPGDQKGIYAHTETIRDELGWNPRYTLDEGLPAMVAWAQRF